MAAFSILSGFKDDSDVFGEEIARGRPDEMKRAARELCREPEACKFAKIVVTHSRHGNVLSRKPHKIAARIERQKARQAARANEALAEGPPPTKKQVAKKKVAKAATD